MDPARGARTALEPVAAPSELEGVELAGRILVDGREPEWPVELKVFTAERDEAGAATRGDGPASFHRRLEPAQHGLFSFGKLPVSWHGRLSSLHHTFEGGATSVDLDHPSPDLVLRLHSAPTITGRIVDPDGKPAALIPLSFELRESKGPASGSDRGTLDCREDGRFRIPFNEDQDSASATLLVEAGGRGYLLHEVPPFSEEAGYDAGDLELEPVRTLEFRVLDSDGLPIPDAFARVEGPSWSSRSEPSDARGESVVRFVPERVALVRFSAFRYADRLVRIGLEARTEVVLERLASLEVQLVGAPETRGSHGRGRVLLTAQGSLFVWGEDDEAPLELQEQLGASRSKRRTRSSDGKGGTVWAQVDYPPTANDHFTFVGLRPDAPFEIEVQASGRSLAVRNISLATGEWQRVEIAVD